MKVRRFFWNWFKKAMSILVSGKMIAWFTITLIPTWLVVKQYIESSHYRDILVAGIAIVTFRGIVEIAEVCKTGKKNGDLDKE